MARNRLLIPLLWFFLIASVFVALAYASMNWHIATRIQVELVTDRVQFTLASDEMKTILPSLPYQSFSVTKFSTIELSPEFLAVADPSKYIFDEDRYPADAWLRLPGVEDLQISGDQGSRLAYVSFEASDNQNDEAGKLYCVMADNNARVNIEFLENARKQIQVDIAGTKSNLQLHVDEQTYMEVDGALPEGAGELPFHSTQMRYRLKLHDHERLIQVNSHSSGLDFSLTLPENKIPITALLQDLPVSAIEFLRQGEKGRPESSIIGEGLLYYPDYPEIKAHKLDRFLRLEQLEKFSIRELRLDQSGKGMYIKLEGIAGIARTGYRDFSEDLTLTLYQIIQQDIWIKILYSIVAFLASATPVAFRFYKEFWR